MTPPIRMSVPVEPTEAMINAYFDTCARHGFRAHINATAAWSAMISAAPAREPEGGAVELIRAAIAGIEAAPSEVVSDTIWTADAAPMTVVDALQLALAALTPKEAPACPHEAYETDSAGQPVRCADCREAPAALCEHGHTDPMALCSDCEADSVEAPAATGAGEIEAILIDCFEPKAYGIPRANVTSAVNSILALRAQPQAREEAQPVGLDEAQRKAVERAAQDAGADCWRHTRLAMAAGDEIVGYPSFSRADMAELARLHTHPATPPAPEAEKLPLSVGTHWWNPDNDESGFTCWGDAFEDATDGGWDGPVRLERARQLLDVWAVRIGMDTDGDGEMDDYEVRLFATEAEALAALQQEDRPDA